MTEAEKAYAEAERLIAKERREQRGWLILSQNRFKSLASLPPEIASLTWLTALDLENTSLTDISPLTYLGNLQRLNLRSTPVRDISPLENLSTLVELFLEHSRVGDLRPCIGIAQDRTGVKALRLYFDDSVATQLDPELLSLSQKDDTEYRTRKTLDYLNSIDDAEYDAFLARRKRELGIIEAEGVSTPPKTSTNARTRAAYLAPSIAAHREVILPLADQINIALRTWQNETGTNQLPEALQLVEHLANGFALAVQQSDVQGLEERLVYLETEGQKLAALLKQEQAKTAALSHELSEAKAARFGSAYREQMGKGLAILSTAAIASSVGLGVTYLLGEAHPITKALIAAISPK